MLYLLFSKVVLLNTLSTVFSAVFFLEIGWLINIGMLYLSKMSMVKLKLVVRLLIVCVISICGKLLINNFFLVLKSFVRVFLSFKFIIMRKTILLFIIIIFNNIRDIERWRYDKAV